MVWPSPNFAKKLKVHPIGFLFARRRFTDNAPNPWQAELMASLEMTFDAEIAPGLLNVSGRLVTQTLERAEAALQALDVRGGQLDINLAGLDALDTAGAMMLATLQKRLETEGVSVQITGLKDVQATLLQTVTDALPDEEGIEDAPRGLVPWLIEIGENTGRAGQAIVSLMNFFGLILHRLGRSVVQPRRIRLAALFSQMQETGLNAVPIVSLMGFLIGVVLAFQGAAQLRQFGAEVFVVDLIAVSILRELGILLTAIIVAGRSGSAFTASIGSMKVREEIDAMRTLGLDPTDVLVLPRVIALVIMLPILGFIANIAGLFGGALMSWIELGVSPSMFITRMHENTDIWHLAVGMIKAPFFAFVISVVACWRAMMVQGSADSVGRETTSSVVQSIFLVIALDAAFSILFAQLGV